MIVEYTKNGSVSKNSGSGDQMIDYLLKDTDHKNEKRESVRTVGGDAKNLRLALNSGRFQDQYVSLVLNFGNDRLTKQQERDVLESFLDCSFPSLNKEQRPAFLAVMHNNEHMHIAIAKEDPITSRKLDAYYHKVDMKRVDSWKRMINAQYDFKSDPNDPANIAFTLNPRENDKHPFTRMYHKNKEEFVQNIAIAIKRKLDSNDLLKNRDDVIKFIETGLKIKVLDNSRNESITIENKIKKDGQNIRLKGFDGLFNKDFNGENYTSDFIEKLSQEYQSKREERYNIAKDEYEKLYAKKSEFIISRYSKPLKNLENNIQFEGRIGTMSVRQQTKEEINYREKFIEAKKQEYKQQLLDKKQIKNLVRDKIVFNSVRKRKVSTLLKNIASQVEKERMQMQDWYQQIRDQSVQRLHAEELTKILKIEANEAKHKLVQTRINENIDKAKGKGQALAVGNEEGFKDYISYCENAGKMTVSSLTLSTSQQLKTNDYQMILAQSQKTLLGSEKHVGVLYSNFDEQKKKTYITILNSRENYKTNELVNVDKEKQQELKNFFKVKNLNEMLETLKDEEVKTIEQEKNGDENGYYNYDTKFIARRASEYDEKFINDGKFRREIGEYRELLFTKTVERNERRDVITQQQARISARRDRNIERGERINPSRIATTFEKLSNSYATQAKQLRELKQKRNKNNGLSL
ncbi:hypothetical protein [Zymobacter sp. IVIA_12111.31 C1]|uniref:hypothetical protein n=1 Tax=Zymobacter sp. IVIA_12111.31 C1 TaxID=3394854 RepID=UPI0039C4E33E